MTREISTELRQVENIVAPGPEDGFSFSPVSLGIQAVGQRILAEGNLLEVQEGILSTCPEPLDNIADRLLRARDTGIPLVEVTVKAPLYTPPELLKLFEGKGVVYSILRTAGTERRSDFWGNHIPYESVGVSIPSPTTFARKGAGLEINANLQNGRLNDYDDSRGPDMWGKERTRSRGSAFIYEDDYDAPSRMQAALARAWSEFETVTNREGSIDGVAHEIVDSKQLTSGGKLLPRQV